MASMELTRLSIIILVLLSLLMQTSTMLEDRANCNDLGVVLSTNENHTTTFDYLQEALNDVLQSNGSSLEVSTMHLSSGTHFVTRPVQFGSKNLRIIGCRNSTKIVCSYQTEQIKDIGIDYTWHFNRSQQLYLQDIQFLNCSYPFRLIAVKAVTVKECTFRKFSEAVFDFFNCETVKLEYSSFLNNSGTGILLETFRGNTGAVGLGYTHYPSFLDQPRISILNCIFIGNRAQGTREIQTSERAVGQSIFTGRGGAVGLFIGTSSHSPILNMTDCLVLENYARLFGGGIYMNINSYGTQIEFTFTRVRIIRNTISNRVQTGGGGVLVALLSASHTYVPPHVVVFSRCTFESNIGEAGGGIYVFTSFVGTHGYYARLEGCNFTNNRGYGTLNEFGAAVGISLATTFVQRVTAERHDIIDCTFSGNSGINGIVSIGYAPVKLSGTNQFENNSGASIRIVGSLVDFYDEMIFRKNHDALEGALSLLSFGQMRIHKGLQMSFNGNFGRLGASITVSSTNSITAFADLLGNTACFAVYEEPLVPPTDWKNVFVGFNNNTAVLGSALYVWRVSHCSWYSYSPPYFEDTAIHDWPIWNIGKDTNTGYQDPHDPEYSIGSRPVGISVDIDEISTWPGKNFNLSVYGIDEFNHVTSINARLYQATGKMPTMKFSSEIVVNAGSSGRRLTESYSVSYSVRDEEGFSQLLNDSSANVLAEETFDMFQISAVPFSIGVVRCPGGYTLTETTTSLIDTHSDQTLLCQCLDIPEVIQCENDQDSVFIKDGYWAGYVEEATPNLLFHPCPPSYCQCSLNSSLGPHTCVYTYIHSNQDKQCATLRHGVLCGSCESGYGVSVLLNNCVTCSDGLISLLPLLVLLEVGVLILIVLVDKPLPSWLHSFIFYIQIIPYMVGYFPNTFRTVSAYMTYLQSALGLYFVYDFCLFSSFSPLLSYLLRYVPATTAVLTLLFIKIARRSHYLRKRSLNYHGYWLIVTLLYPGLVHTSLTVLDCPLLPDSDGTISARWFVDGSIQCFNGWHIPLALLAIFILLVCFLSVIVIVTVVLKTPSRLKKLIVPMTLPYKEGMQWLAGLELGQRFLLLTFTVTVPLNTVYAIIILVVSLTIYAYVLPYKSVTANACVVMVLSNMILLLLMSTAQLVREMFSKTDIVAGGAGNWILYCLFYLPILLLIVVCFILLAQFFVRSVRKRRSELIREEALEATLDARPKFSQSTSYTLRVMRDREGDELIMDTNVT